MNNRVALIFLVAIALLPTAVPMVFAQDLEVEVPSEAICTVCARRGAVHGPEAVAAWRQHEGVLYTFCSVPCGEAFDQMPEGYSEPELPRPAPSVALLDLAGEPIDLVAKGARATLVDFWATWCTPCLEMMPTLSRLHQERADEGFRVVGISIDEDREKLEKFLKKRAPEYPVVHDGGDDPAWWAFRVPAVPATFLLDADGQIVDQWDVDFTEEKLLRALALLSETVDADAKE